MDHVPAILLQALTAFVIQFVLLTALGIAATCWVQQATARPFTDLETLLLRVTAPVGFGYAAFWVYFAQPWIGRAFSWATIVAVAATIVRSWAGGKGRRGGRSPLLVLTVSAGMFYLCALFVYPGESFSASAQTRYTWRMPGDNEIPGIFAGQVYGGAPNARIMGDWLMSDRPPLQTGIALLTLPAMRAISISDDLSCAIAGMWFQLLWIPSLWVFLRWLGVTSREAISGCAGLVFTGFLTFHSIFVWPKLGAAALVLLAFCVLFFEERPDQEGMGASRKTRFAFAGALMAFAVLAHGGPMFSILAVAVLVVGLFIGAARQWRWTPWLCAGSACAVLYAPWLCYQRFYDPPGNRLVKWHLAGAIQPDERSVLTTLRENYRAQGWAKSWAAKRDNLLTIFHGDWKELFDWRGGPHVMERRTLEWYYVFHTAGLWLLGGLALPWLLVRSVRGSFSWRGRGVRHVLALIWLALTLGLWAGLMFIPNSTVVHQGSFAVELLILGLAAAWALLVGRIFFLVLFAIQASQFAATWIGPGPDVAVPANHVAEIWCLAAAGIVIFVLVRNLTGERWRPTSCPAAIPG